jgi:hypothetical protein
MLPVKTQQEGQMELRTKELRERLPALYGHENAGADPIVHAKFFTPDAEWTWYVTEGSPDDDDFRFFGFVEGVESEWGYFLLSDLQAVRERLGLSVERDQHFVPVRFSRIPQVR